ncbi:cytochrome c oxidase subunit 1 [Podochytrium sp. JEL0797]|nr:cytochrome c oxidase subunit 1 [Podochytrium sp. JEL0797]
MVIDEYIKLKGKTPLETKLAYLDVVKECRFYGAAIFEIEAPGDLSFNEPVDVAISAAGVQLVQSINREVAMVFACEEISDVQLDENTVSIMIGKPLESSTEVYEFCSDRAEEMVQLIRDYCGIRTAPAKERVYTESDLINLKTDVEAAQLKLVENEIVRVPGPDTFAAEMGQGPDKISDIIFKCEKASSASQTSDKVHFIIKKRLFDEPLKPCGVLVEDDFVRWQVVEDIKNDRYPLKMDDLITMAALTAQIQFGDAILGALENYTEFTTKVIPKRHLSDEMCDKIAAQHLKLVGKKAVECHELFMAVAKAQPLFGYTVFSVLQSYTNQLPRECWLAIGFDGIRILARRSLSIFATHPYADLINYIPAKNNILLVTENRTTLGSKYMSL